MKRICALLLTAALLTGPAAAAGETAEAAQPALDLSAASAVLMERPGPSSTKRRPMKSWNRPASPR